MSERVLTRRALNRATLSRQLLLERAHLPAREAIEQLAGLQAQNPNAPYVGLWTRVQPFSREDLTLLIEQRQVVRATLMRATLHLMTADDYALLRPALQPALARSFRAFFSQEAKRLDVAKIIEHGRAYLEGHPRTFTELRAHFSALEPHERPESLAYVVRTHVPLVQVPPAGTWGQFGSPTWTLAESSLGRPLTPPDEGLHQIVIRYLRAFGPATRQDIEAWSGLRGLQHTLEDMGPHLREYWDDRDRVLLDLPDLPLPDPDVPAPVRFLPEFDNLILSHADRTRVMPDAYRSRVFLSAGRVRATFLVDGMVTGTWRIERERDIATLVIEPFEQLPAQARRDLIEEGERLVHFVENSITNISVRIADDAQDG